MEVRFHGSRNAPPSDNLYVKGLPAWISEDEVRQVFVAYGSVLRLKVMPPPVGVDDATALVRMGSVAEAQWAVDSLSSGTSIGELSPGTHQQYYPQQGHFPENVQRQPIGRPQPSLGNLEVKFHGGKAAPPSDNLYVKGLPAWFSEEEVRQTFAPYGSIIRLKVMPPPAGAADATALVRMGSVDEAFRAVDAFGAQNSPA